MTRNSGTFSRKNVNKENVYIHTYRKIFPNWKFKILLVFHGKLRIQTENGQNQMHFHEKTPNQVICDIEQI